MKNIFYLLSIIILSSACSVSTSDDGAATSGTSDGTASAPVELTVGTAKTGGIAKYGSSYYKFTPASTGAGSYKLEISSLVITDS